MSFPLFILLIVTTVVFIYLFIVGLRLFDKAVNALDRAAKRKQYNALISEHPEWAAELNPDKIEEENELEKEQRDREEFERLAKEHPEWLK